MADKLNKLPEDLVDLQVSSSDLPDDLEDISTEQSNLPPLDLVDIQNKTKELTKPQDTPIENILEGSAGTVAGALSGYGLKKVADPIGDYLQEASDKLRFDQISRNSPVEAKKLLEQHVLRQGKDFINEKDIGRLAKEEGIGGKLGLYDKKKAGIKAQKVSSQYGKEQGDLLRSLELEAPEVSKKDIYTKMLKEYRKEIGDIEGKSAYNELTDKWTPSNQVNDKQQLLTRYNELKQFEQDAKALGIPQPEIEKKELNKIESILSAEQNPNEKLTLSEIEKQKSSIPYEVDAESNLAKGRNIRSSTLRKATEDAIQSLPNGDEKLSQFIDAKKKTASSEVLKDLTLEGAVKDKSMLKTLESMDISRPATVVKPAWSGIKNVSEPLLDVAGKGIKLGGKALPLLGAIVGGTTGALAAEPGEATQGAIAGIAESFSPAESLGNAELPKSQMAREALDAQMAIRAKEGEEAMKVRQMPIEEKKQPIEALKGKLDYTPSEMQQVSEKLLSMQGGKSYADVLNKALQQPERTRKAIVFGLLQQPAFRELMKKVERGE